MWSPADEPARQPRSLTESDVRRIVREEIAAAQEDITSAVIQRMVQARRATGMME